MKDVITYPLSKFSGSRDCKHGQLARVCNICELEEEVKELQTGNQAKILKEAIEKQGIGKVIPVLDWVDIQKQAAIVEEETSKLKALIFKAAQLSELSPIKIKGV